MKNRPDFIQKFRQNNRIVWETVIGIAQRYKGQIILNPETEANRLCWVITKRRGWRVYHSEFLVFVDNIRRLLYILNT
jgi:hypothetical protein